MKKKWFSPTFFFDPFWKRIIHIVIRYLVVVSQWTKATSLVLIDWDIDRLNMLHKAVVVVVHLCSRSNTATKQPLMQDNKLFNIKAWIPWIYLNRSVGTTNTPGSCWMIRSGLNPCRHIPMWILLRPLGRLSSKLPLSGLLSPSLFLCIDLQCTLLLMSWKEGKPVKERVKRRWEKLKNRFRGWQGLRQRGKARDRVHRGGNGREEGGGVDSLRGRAPPGIPLQPRKMPREMIIK